MKRLKVVVFLLAAMVWLAACEKEIVVEEEREPELVLHELEILQDAIILRWSSPDSADFIGYHMVRSKTKIEGDEVWDFRGSYMFDRKARGYYDIHVPIAPYVEYQVVGVMKTENDSINEYVLSNTQVYERPWIKLFAFDLQGAIPDLGNNRFFIVDKNKIAVLDYESQSMTRTVETEVELGYGWLGEHQHVQELYVAGADSMVAIYDAETLEKIDSVEVGHPARSVVYDNGILYVTAFDLWRNLYMKVYDRATKQLIAERKSDYDESRERVMPGREHFEIMQVGIEHNRPAMFRFFRFDALGEIDSLWSIPYFHYHRMDADLFAIFPDGKHFITAPEGYVYDMNLNFVRQLADYQFSFSGYHVDAEGQVLYGSHNGKKGFVAYSLPGLEKVGEYKTLGYPYRMFKKDNTMICISTTGASGSYSKLVEEVPLD